VKLYKFHYYQSAYKEEESNTLLPQFGKATFYPLLLKEKG
jgi:hypothetical protein